MTVSALFTFTPSPPGDRAEQAIPLALELVDAVRRFRPVEVRSVLDRADLDALVVVLAAMVDDDSTVSELLGWLDGRPRPRTVTARHRTLKECGTHAAYNRHKDRGEPIDPRCEAEERRYQERRHRARRAAQQAERDDAAEQEAS